MTTTEAEAYLSATTTSDKKLPGLPIGVCRFLIQELLTARKALETCHPQIKQGTIPTKQYMVPVAPAPIRSPQFGAVKTKLTNKRIDTYAKAGHYGKEAQLAAEARALKSAKPKQPSLTAFLNDLLKDGPTT